MLTLSTSPVVSDMQMKARERYDKHEYQLVSDFPPYTDFAEKTFLGLYSYTTTRTRRRILLASEAKTFICEVPQSPTEVSRDYLDVVFPRPLRATREQRDAITIPRSAPLYYQPTHIQGGVYVDLVSAYLQLLDVIGWDVDYYPHKYLGAGRPPSDFPLRHNKTARNNLVSCGLSSSVSVWSGYKLEESYPRNIHINYGLWSAIQDILHELARSARAFGAFYIATDGYILPDSNAEAFQEYLQEEWKIKTTVKAFGETVATGLGSYAVGDYVTQRFHGCVDPPYSNIDPKSDEMLRKTYKSIASNRIDKPYLTMLD